MKASFFTWTMPEGETEPLLSTKWCCFCSLSGFNVCVVYAPGLGSTLKMRCPSCLHCPSAACEYDSVYGSCVHKGISKKNVIKSVKELRKLISLLLLIVCSALSSYPQDKAIHTTKAAAPGPIRVQAQWCDEGVPAGRLFKAHPDRAPPVGPGPQVAQGPPSGPPLRPEAGQRRSDHWGLF